MAKAEDRLRPRTSLKHSTPFAALDIGCAKTSCLIAKTDKSGKVHFLGGGHQQSRGFSGGAVTDMEALERSIRLAVEDAECAAGGQIQDVVLGVTGPRVESHFITAEIALNGREVTRKEVRKVQAAALGSLEMARREILCVHPVYYAIDGQTGIRLPIGMAAETLGVRLCVVSAPSTMLHNLVECVRRAHLRVVRLVPSAIASGAGVLIEDEVTNGALCIDLGAGVTALSVFMHGAPAWMGLVPLGGQHITSDLAQGLGTTFAVAERLKTIHGQANVNAGGLSERIEIPILGNNGRLQSSRGERGKLTQIIVPRAEETFELIAKEIANSPLKGQMPRRAVITGGASQLPGIEEIAGRVLKMPVRRGQPNIAEILGETYAHAGFATAAGLINYMVTGYPEAARTSVTKGSTGAKPKSFLNRALSWLKENI